MLVTKVYTLNNNLRPSSACYDLIKGFEGFRAKPYYCAGGKLTIGYGTTRGVTSGMTVTHEQAMKMLHDDVKVFGEAVNKLAVFPLNQNQYDALVCWTYNLGAESLRKSTMLKFINQGDFDNAAKELLKWHFIKKIFSRGLANRREAEYALFTKPMPVG
jgi:lysozyme